MKRAIFARDFTVEEKQAIDKALSSKVGFPANVDTEKAQNLYLSNYNQCQK